MADELLRKDFNKDPDEAAPRQDSPPHRKVTVREGRVDQTPAETGSFKDTLALFQEQLALFPFDSGLAVELAQGIPKTHSRPTLPLNPHTFMGGYLKRKLPNGSAPETDALAFLDNFDQIKQLLDAQEKSHQNALQVEAHEYLENF